MSEEECTAAGYPIATDADEEVQSRAQSQLARISEKWGSMSSPQLKCVALQTDVDGNGDISAEEEINAAFTFFDTDNDQCLSREERAQMLTGATSALFFSTQETGRI